MHTFDTIPHQPQRFRRNTTTNDDNNNNTYNSQKSTRTHHYNNAPNTAINTSPRVCACIHRTRNDQTLSGEHRHTSPLPLFPTRNTHTHTHTHAVQGRNVSLRYKLQTTSKQHKADIYLGCTYILRRCIRSTTYHTNRGGFGATPPPTTTT